MTDAQSPRLAALESQLAANEQQALAQFWAELQEVGTPLVEPAEDAGSVLVTLVLRVGADEERFVAWLGLAGAGPARPPLTPPRGH